MSADFCLWDHGTICLLSPLSEAAQGWIDEFIPEDSLMFGNAIVIEPRYAPEIVHGIVSDGLTVTFK